MMPHATQPGTQLCGIRRQMPYQGIDAEGMPTLSIGANSNSCSWVAVSTTDASVCCNIEVLASAVDLFGNCIGITGTLSGFAMHALCGGNRVTAQQRSSAAQAVPADGSSACRGNELADACTMLPQPAVLPASTSRVTFTNTRSTLGHMLASATILHHLWHTSGTVRILQHHPNVCTM